MSETFFSPTELLLGLKAFTDIGAHNERATEGDWEGGWGSVQCRLTGGGCDPQGSVDNTGVASSWTITFYSTSKTEEDFWSVGTAAGEAVRDGCLTPPIGRWIIAWLLISHVRNLPGRDMILVEDVSFGWQVIQCATEVQKGIEREVKVNTEQKPQQSGMLGQLGVCHQEVVWSCLPQILLVFDFFFFSFLVVWDAVDSTGNKVRRRKLTLLWMVLGSW